MAEVNYKLRAQVKQIQEAIVEANARFEDLYREKVLGKELVSNPAGLHKVEDFGKGLQGAPLGSRPVS